MRKIIISLVALGAVFLFTGCSNKSFGEVYKIPPQKTQKDKLRCEQATLLTNTVCGDNADYGAVVAHSNKSTFGFYHIAMNNNIKAAMQTVLELGSGNKLKYMSIVAPKTISNKDGSLVNTVEGFMDKCLMGPGDIIARNARCEINPSLAKSSFTVEYHNEKPKDRLVYDIEKEYKYFKDNGYYDSSLEGNYDVFHFYKVSDAVAEKVINKHGYKNRVRKYNELN